LKTFPSIVLVIFLLAGCAGVHGQEHYPFQNPSLPAQQRIDNLMLLLTLQEKIDLLGQTLDIPRLGIHAAGSAPTIPGSYGQFEGLHGLAVGGVNNWGRRSPGGTAGPYPGDSPVPTTQFPEASGLGETWDPALLQKLAAQEGFEARYIFQSYDRGGLIIRAPNADLERDPRWGRSEESYGEDPYLDSVMAVAFVKGLQGDDPHYWLTASLVKHFMANSNEDLRTSSSSNFDAALLHEYYSAPFRAAIEEGGANAIMASYNAVNGIPMTASPFLKSLVMDKWGLNGIIDSDRGAVTSMVTKHKYYSNMNQATAGALLAGINQFLNPYEQWVHEDLANHSITEADIDKNVKGVLRVLLRLGLLDGASSDPYKGPDPYLKVREGYTPIPWLTQEAKDLALRATEESIVLLKNAPVAGSARLLPLDASKIKSIAVVGPRADEVDADGYGGTPPFAITPFAGIRGRAGTGVVVRYTDDPDQAVELARRSDLAIVVVGNLPLCGDREHPCPDPSAGKEGVDRKQIALDEEQQKLVEDVYAANPRTIVVLVSGFPYALGWSQDHVPAIVHMAPSSEEEGEALADVLFGNYDPGGRLVVTWPESISQLPPMMDYNLRDGRTYMYAKDKPLYPFGYGLSYTTFKYSKMKVSSSKLPEDSEVVVSVNVTNTGRRAGDEVVQLYIQQLHQDASGPREALKGFERVALREGETRTVTFHLRAKDLAHWDEATQRWSIKEGPVRVMIGSSSADITAEKSIVVVHTTSK
jgi:beta-glucosidase